MASYIAEGIRMSGHDVEQKRISEIKTEKDISGYDGYVFGCPTYHRDMTEGMKRFLFVAHSAGL
jgi:flavorubredoxin